MDVLGAEDVNEEEDEEADKYKADVALAFSCLVIRYAGGL